MTDRRIREVDDTIVPPGRSPAADGFGACDWICVFAIAVAAIVLLNYL
jgi:hypothetical protein